MSPIKILIADDDIDDIFFFEEAVRSLKLADYLISSFQNGKLLLEYLESIELEELIPDLIVLDLNMPVIDGIAALARIKSSPRLRNIPVFVLTTSKNPDHMKKCRELGCINYYVKPFDMTELKAIISDIILMINKSRD